MWSWSSTCGFTTSGMTMHLPFMMTPSITAMLSLNDLYSLTSWCSWSLLSGQPAITKHFSHCKCSSYTAACCICWIDMHSGASVYVCTVSTLTSIPNIASSLFSLWLCWDSQSAIKISGPSLYIILTLY